MEKNMGNGLEATVYSGFREKRAQRLQKNGCHLFMIGNVKGYRILPGHA